MKNEEFEQWAEKIADEMEASTTLAETLLSITEEDNDRVLYNQQVRELHHYELDI